jgi:hypothetical protein
MSFTLPERQAILFCSCPKNVGNLRQFACYCRQVGLLIAYRAVYYYNLLRFSAQTPLSGWTVILSSQSSLDCNVLCHLRVSSHMAQAQLPVLSGFLTLLCVLNALNSAASLDKALFFSSALKSPSFSRSLPLAPSSFHPPPSHPAKAVQIPRWPISASHQFPSSIQNPASAPHGPGYPPAPK